MTICQGLRRFVCSMRFFIVVYCLAFSAWLICGQLYAASGTWNMDLDGTWEDNASGVWAGNIVPEGAGFAANFDFDIAGDRTVTMNADHTIGQLIFRDKTTNSNNWTLAAGAGADLLLDNNVPSPVINVLNRTATISAPLGGTKGVALTGGSSGVSAQLILSGNNTYSGGTTITSSGG